MKKKNIISQIEEVAKTYKSFKDCYKLLTKNSIETCNFCLDSDGKWKRLELKWMMEYFISIEEYEKCAVLKNFINNNFVANKSKQKELNKKLQEYLNNLNSNRKK